MWMQMEKTILKSLHTQKPTPTRRLMRACRVKSTSVFGVLSDAEHAFIKLLAAMENKGRVALIESQGWIKT